jgi:hypothetical protein
MYLLIVAKRIFTDQFASKCVISRQKKAGYLPAFGVLIS